MVVCSIGAKDQSPVFLLWGDSHANAVATAVNLSAADADAAGYLIWKSGCPPLAGIDRTDHSNQECSNFSRDVIDFVKDHQEIETVILSSRWAISAVGTRYKTEEGNSVTLIDSETPESRNTANGAVFESGLKRTVEELVNLGREVILVNPVPEVGYHVPSAFFVADRTGRDITEIIAPTMEEFKNRNEVVLSVLSELSANNIHVWNVDPTEILCDELICQVVQDNKPLYNDDNHLSTAGGQLITEIFDPIFENIKTP